MGCIVDQIHLGECTGNAELFILNSNKQVLPVGVPGELHVAGIGVAAGYTNHDLDDAVFWETEGQKCYKTGDLVYLDCHQTLHYVGRIPKDKQVKIGSVRVELFEIEHALKSLRGVQFAHVSVGKERTNQLMAYVCPKTLDIEDIKVALAGVLPANIIPPIIIPVSKDNISFNNSGKLVVLEQTCPVNETLFSHGEEKIVSVFRKCFGSIMVNNLLSSEKTLSAYGVDSISILTLVNELKSTFGFYIRPSEIINNTLSQLMIQFNSSQPAIDEHLSISGVSDYTEQKKVVTDIMYSSFSALNQIGTGPTYNVPISVAK